MGLQGVPTPNDVKAQIITDYFTKRERVTEIARRYGLRRETVSKYVRAVAPEMAEDDPTLAEELYDLAHQTVALLRTQQDVQKRILEGDETVPERVRDYVLSQPLHEWSDYTNGMQCAAIRIGAVLTKINAEPPPAQLEAPAEGDDVIEGEVAEADQTQSEEVASEHRDDA